VPLPVRDSTNEESPALLKKERVAVAVPLLCGVNATENDAVLPAAMVNGKETPLKLNSGLLIVAEEIEILEPLALSVPARVLLVPSVTLPKFIVDGDTVSRPAAIPVPARGTPTIAFVESETWNPPFTGPGACGENVIVKVKLCPGVKVRGKDNPFTVNPTPTVSFCEMVMLAFLELVSVTRSVTLLPTGTPPKNRLGGLENTELLGAPQPRTTK
jgi:hypothetical protein